MSTYRQQIRLCVGAAIASLMCAVVAAPTPAMAASNSSLTVPGVVAFHNGAASIPVTCRTKAACKGSVGIAGAGWVATKYSIPGKTRKNISVKVKANTAADPRDLAGTAPLYARSAHLRFAETSPKKRTATFAVSSQKRIFSQLITGTISGKPGPEAPAKVRVELIPVSKLGTTNIQIEEVNWESNGTFRFRVPLGANNAASAARVLRVSGNVKGNAQAWYWRGSHGATTGGGRYAGEATAIRASASRPYAVPVRFGSIAGHVAKNGENVKGATVYVAMRPAVFPSTQRERRALDFDACANLMLSTTTDPNGNYVAGFLPQAQTAPKRFGVYVDDNDPSTVNRWNDTFSSCQHLTTYNRSTNNLIALPAADSLTPATQDFDMRPATSTVNFAVKYTKFSRATEDRHYTLRAYIPGKKVLQSPILFSGRLAANGKASRTVPAGKYWAEVGRNASCANWYSSVYGDNNKYFKGLDRGAERWKVVRGSKAQYKTSIAHGFPTAGKKLPRGKKGWMYREYCRTNTAGMYRLISVGENGTVAIGNTLGRGATISGRVTRPKGALVRDTMVSVYSTNGTLVMRSAIAGGSGKFTVFGLASGTYRIEVNSDSWRGNNHSFRGTHSKKVKAGKNYSVGTLRMTS